jgi:cytochrome o ubiquinol oxidase operon protein cyoD
MSAAHTHNDHDDHGHSQDHADHGTFKSYMTGFILSVILTAIPFALVMGKAFHSSSTASLVLLGFAAVQIVVHMIYFLHMSSKSEHGWTMLALVFTGVLLFIMMSGSIWVMYHMNHNMMPGMVNESTMETKPESIPGTMSEPNPAGSSDSMQQKQ